MSDDDMKIKIKLEIDADETIKLHTDIRGTIMTMVMRTREKMIRDALILLGWTPPGKFSDALAEEGYVIVPREPTEAMIEEGGNRICRDCGTGKRAVVAYRAMIKAAPKP